jgi:hypothetical protein
VVLFEADDKVIDEGAHRRREAALCREHRVDQSGLFTPVRQQADEPTVMKLLLAEVVGDKGDPKTGDGRRTEHKELS